MSHPACALPLGFFFFFIFFDLAYLSLAMVADANFGRF
jgi:hypothetical protein